MALNRTPRGIVSTAARSIVFLVATVRGLDHLRRGWPLQPGPYPQQAAGDDADGKHRNEDPEHSGHPAIVRLRPSCSGSYDKRTVPVDAARTNVSPVIHSLGMDTVTVRDLRNNGGEVLRRVERGERIVVTRDGTPVAELRPLPRSSAGPAELIRRRKNLPQVSPDALRRDIDNLIDPSL